MKTRFYPILILISILILATIPLTSAQTLENNSTYEHVEKLTKIGPRLAGTEAENIAVSYIEGKFENYGLSVKVEDFILENAYMYEGGQLSVLEPVEENIKFLPLIRSPPTDGVLVENMVYYENLSEKLISLKNFVVLVSRKNFEEVRKESPKAIVLFEENMPSWTQVYPAKELKSPVITISFESAKNLIRLLDQSQNVTLKLRTNAKLEKRTSHNVIATLPGESDRTIIVSAHHDTVLSEGAVDDASGVAVMLQTAQELSKEKMKRTIKFVSFGAEEYGLVGSSKYVENIEKGKVIGVLDFDSICPGPPDGLRIGLKGSGEKDTTPWLDKYVGKVAKKLDFEYSFGAIKEAEGYSDYYSFVKNGIPATWIYWVSGKKENPLWPVHTLDDNLDRISMSNLEKSVSLSISTVESLSGGSLEGWLWSYRFPDRLSFFMIFSSVMVVVGLAIVGFVRYVEENKESNVLFFAFFVVSAGILLLYFFVLS